MQRIMSWVLVLVLSTTMLSSCLKSTNTEPEKLAYLYLMHMAPTAPAVDFYFGTDKLSTNSIDFGTISGNYLAIRPSTFDVTYKKGGSDSVVATVPTAVYDTLKPYTLLLFSDEDGNGRATRIFDDVRDVDANKTNFRFWHLGQDIGPVDFYIGTTKVDTYRTLADNVGSFALNAFTPFEPGSYTITVKEAGTDTEIAKTEQEANLGRGAVYTIVLRGLQSGTGTKKAAVNVIRNF